MDEIIQQLEFLRDMGAESIDVGANLQTGLRPATQSSAARPAAAAAVPAPAAPAPMAQAARQSASASAPQVIVPTAAAQPPMQRAPITNMTPTKPPGQKTATLTEVRDELGDCQRCKLSRTRTHIVFGSGNLNAEIVFVGEAPGHDEDIQGLPFVGRAGQLLTKIIASIAPGEISREDVYICNVLKCRPPDNRNPMPDEVAACSPFMRLQLGAIRPKIVCCLGTFAAQTVLNSTTPIGKLRGQFYDLDGIRVIATFHPAYLLRSPERKRDAWEDMKMIGTELTRLRSL